MAELLTGRPLFPGDDREQRKDICCWGLPVTCLEIDQITKVLNICGTPTNETLSKITSEEVLLLLIFALFNDFSDFQAILYIRSLPQMEKQDFQTVFPDANPMGENEEENLNGMTVVYFQQSI